MAGRESVWSSILRQQKKNGYQMMNRDVSAPEKVGIGTVAHDWTNYKMGLFKDDDVIVDGIWNSSEHGKPIHGISMKRDSRGLITVRCSANKWCAKDKFTVSQWNGLRLYKTCDDCLEETFPSIYPSPKPLYSLLLLTLIRKRE